MLNVLAVKISFPEEDRRNSGLGTVRRRRSQVIARRCPFPCIFILMPHCSSSRVPTTKRLCKDSCHAAVSRSRTLQRELCESKGEKNMISVEDMDRVNENNSGSAKQTKCDNRVATRLQMSKTRRWVLSMMLLHDILYVRRFRYMSETGGVVKWAKTRLHITRNAS